MQLKIQKTQGECRECKSIVDLENIDFNYPQLDSCAWPVFYENIICKTCSSKIDTKDIKLDLLKPQTTFVIGKK